MYKRLPDDTPAILRSYGLKVVPVPGWKRRGRPESTGGFDPVGVLCHHTATAIGTLLTVVLRLLIRGRSDLPGPLCHFGLSRKGTVYLIAAGRANHAGTAKASGTVAAGDGNELYYGIEAFNNGIDEHYTPEQYRAFVLLSAVLSLRFTHSSAQTVRAHKETSVTGKIDPRLDMDRFREKVADKMIEYKDGPPKKTRGKRIDHSIKDLKVSRGHSQGEKLKHVQAALAALLEIKPRYK